MKRFLSALLAVFMIATLICVPTFAEGEAIVADTSWYNAEETVYYIEDAADFMGLAEVAKTTDFAGKTIELTADIDLNPGWDATVTVDADTKATTLPAAPANVFAGIPSLKGTFDGNGHTVTGMYVAAQNITAGFGFIHYGSGNCVVKDVAFLNSLVYASTSNDSNWGMGGVMGHYVDAAGTLLIENVYADINVVNQRLNGNAKNMVGGILGRMDNVKAPTLGCDPDNTVDVDGDGTVEPLYWVESANANLVGCVYAGMIVTMNANSIANNKVLNVSQLVAGTNKQSFATSAGHNEAHESNVDYMWDRATNCVAMGDTTYATANNGNTGENYGEGKIDFYNVIEGAKPENSEINADLFKVCKFNGSAPFAPAAFYDADLAVGAFAYSAEAGAIVPVAVAEMLKQPVVYVADTSWYDAEADVYYIEDEADFLGLAEVSKTVDFAGKTVVLTADIDLNPEWDATVTVDADTKATTLPEAPLNAFAGIPTFKGTFDGNGHTVSGMYIAAQNITGAFGFIHTGAGDCVVKNVVFTNSLVYASTNHDSNWGMGGVMGTYRDGTGTLLIDNVYADINVVNQRLNSNAKNMVGGVLGRMETVKAPTLGFDPDNTVDVDGDGTVEPLYWVESANANLNNCVYAGMIVTVNAEMVANNKVLNVSQLVAGTNSQNFKTSNGDVDAPHESNVNYMWDRATNCVAMGDTTYAMENGGTHEDYGEGKIDFYNVIEGAKPANSVIDESLFKVSAYASNVPAAFYDADTADFVYSNVAGAIVPATVAAMLNNNAWAQIGELEGGAKALRILTGLESLDFAEVGYLITVGDVTEATGAITTVYESVTAAGENVAASDLDENYAYLYGLVIKNIPDNCTLTVTPTVTTAKGTVVTLHSFTVEIVDGAIVQ